MSENPEIDYFKNEEKSDVLFVVERKPIPAYKSFLSEKSIVFSAMFSENFKESKDKEIVIEDTTYEAFNTFIQFLYCDDLVLKDDNNSQLMRELYRLSDRYDVFRLAERIIHELIKRNRLNGFECVSDEDFNRIWLQITPIERIAFESQLLTLIEDSMTSYDINFDHFLRNNDLDLNDFHLIRELYELTNRYDVSSLRDRITAELFKMNFYLFFGLLCKSKEWFHWKWQRIGSIARIAFELNVSQLIEKVMIFIDKNLVHFLMKDMKELIELNVLTDGRLFSLLIEKCTESRFHHMKELMDKTIEIIHMMTIISKKMNDLKESLKKVKSFNCDECGAFNHVQSTDAYSKCEECNQLFCNYN